MAGAAKVLAAAIAIFLLVLSISAADTWTPDWDGSPLNNSFDTAEDMGTVGQAGVTITGKLGQLLWGFDTTDFYRITIPFDLNYWDVTFELEEMPEFSMGVSVYTSQGVEISPGIGQGNPRENFTLPLSNGIYFVEVNTNTGAAQNRELTYALKIRPKIVPFPDAGGTYCGGAPILGDVGRQWTLDGALTPSAPSSYYAFWVPYGFALYAAMLGSSPSYKVTVIDRIDSTRLLYADPQHRQGYMLLDPGFYCLAIEGTLPNENYRFSGVANTAGLRPGTTRASAQRVVDMELGNLTQNGKYGTVSRYIHYQQQEIPNLPNVLETGHEYVIRDWVGTASPRQIYWFELAEEQKVELRLYNLLATARASIEDTSGTIIANTTSTGSALGDLLPTQNLDIKLSPGRYYIDIDYLSQRSPGTSFGLWLRVLDPA